MPRWKAGRNWIFNIMQTNFRLQRVKDKFIMKKVRQTESWESCDTYILTYVWLQ
jgi:hypothetical protein